MTATPTILIIDDCPEIGSAFGKMLKHDGYRVEVCLDGASGLARAAELRPDLILLDVVMPEIDGLEVCRRLRRDTELSEVPVVMVTGLGDDASRLAGIEAGADGFLCKPCSLPELRAVVRTIMRLDRYHQLLEERERFARLAQLAPYGLALVGRDDLRVRFANSELSRLLACEDLLEHRLSDWVAAEYRPLFEAHLKELPGHTLEVQLAQGGWVAVDVGPLLWDRSPALQLVIRDVSEQKHYTAQLARQANFDTLTGLANRNLLQDRLGQALASGSGSVILVDLDRFHHLNESLSMAAGDAVLCEVGRRLVDGLPAGSTVARFGGDEFALVVPGLSEQAAALELCAGLQKELLRPFAFDGKEVVVSASFGLTVYPELSREREELLQQAELALYQGKREGSSLHAYHPRLRQGLPGRLELERDLHQAVLQQQLHLLYQPRVDRRGRLAGAEALVRWQHPERGLISPAQFIPLAEETGLIVPIGRWVLGEALRQLSRWRAMGLPAVNVGVNVSPRQFHGDDLVALCATELQRHDVEARWLGLEVTESAAMQNPDAALQTLHQLSRMGIEISLDDFGTGYSSLAYLTRLPLSYLKIDRSFVRHAATRQADGVVAARLIQLARSLKVHTVAEGVEEAAQRDFLLSRGCDQLQGYYFSPPVSSAEFEKMLASRRRWPTKGAKP